MQHHGIPAWSSQYHYWSFHLWRQRLQFVVNGRQWALFANFDTLFDCHGGFTSSTFVHKINWKLKNDQWGQLSILALDFNFGIWSKMSMPNFTFQGDFRGSVKIIFKVCIEQKSGDQKIAKLWEAWSSFAAWFQSVPGGKIICKLSLGAFIAS